MKQVPLTDALRQKLTALGADATRVAVFEATALNTGPVRKNHPIYKGAVHSRGILQQMADAVNAESLPLHIQHNSAPLPIGRVFLGEVLDNSQGSELRALFWIDHTNQQTIDLVNNGTVDQVSVSVLPKQALCSKCGFDFFGEEATIDHIWTGTCPKDHTMGKDGAHVTLDTLDRWFELSLVGQGGIKGARIASPSETRLAANGSDATFLTLNISSTELARQEKPKMDLDKLVNDLTDVKAQNLTLTSDKTALTAQLAAKDTEIGAQAAEIARLTAANAELTGKVTTLEASATNAVAATAALADIGKHVLTIAGRVADSVPEKIEDIVALVKSTKLSISGTSATSAEGEGNEGKVIHLGNAAFKRR